MKTNFTQNIATQKSNTQANSLNNTVPPLNLKQTVFTLMVCLTKQIGASSTGNPSHFNLLNQIPEENLKKFKVQWLKNSAKHNHSKVYFGRGGKSNTNPGNIIFRNVINLSYNQFNYKTLGKNEKTSLSQQLCQFFQTYRFIFEKDSSTNNAIKRITSYTTSNYENNKIIRQKISQILRETEPKQKLSQPLPSLQSFSDLEINELNHRLNPNRAEPSNTQQKKKKRTRPTSTEATTRRTKPKKPNSTQIKSTFFLQKFEPISLKNEQENRITPNQAEQLKEILSRL